VPLERGSIGIWEIDLGRTREVHDSIGMVIMGKGKVEYILTYSTHKIRNTTCNVPHMTHDIRHTTYDVQYRELHSATRDGRRRR
jgi:hypothetical protein